MRSLDAAHAAVFAADAATAAAAAWNTAWLTTHWLHLAPRPRNATRRMATLSLAVLNAGIAVQAAFAQLVYSTVRFGLDTTPLFETAPWLASRALLLAGVLLISLLILRRPS